VSSPFGTEPGRRCQVAERLARSGVSALWSRSRRGVAVARTGRCLREVLGGRRTVEILVSLPAAKGCTARQSRCRSRSPRQILVSGHLGALVPGEGPFQVGRDRGECSDDCGVHAGRCVVDREVDDDPELGFAFRKVTIADADPTPTMRSPSSCRPAGCPRPRLGACRSWSCSGTEPPCPARSASVTSGSAGRCAALRQYRL